MRRGDIPQVLAIDKEAFPTQWPPPSYTQELRNRLNRYLVVWERNHEDYETAQNQAIEGPENNTPPSKGRVKRFLHFIRHLFDRSRFWGPEETPIRGPKVVGYVGFVTVFDETHINSIAVHKDYRRRGLGELLLASVIEMSQELNARTVSLEVRVSNEAAKALYRKYGFRDAGIRKRYYDDNGEDGLFMNTEPITTPSFQQQIRALKASLEEKLDP